MNSQMFRLEHEHKSQVLGLQRVKIENEKASQQEQDCGTMVTSLTDYATAF
jgi:hypothetical protein